jgi:anti-anti-sigma factor
MDSVREHPSYDSIADSDLVHIGVTSIDGIAVITVIGELDASNSACLSECLHDQIGDGVAEMVVDIEHLTYLDSSGLAVLLKAQKRMAAAGGSLSLFAPMPNVERLLEVTGLVSLLNVQSAEDWARRS